MDRFTVFIAELKRRRVFRAVATWGLVAFGVLQVAEPVLHALGLGEGALRATVAILVAGFPVVVMLAWAYDLGARGLVRTEGPPVPGPRGLRLALVLLAIGLALAAPGLAWLAWTRHASTAVSTSAAAGSSAEPTVAVLPFADLSPNRDQGYLADGVAEEILSALARVDGLQVTGRISSFSVGAQPGADVATIAARLHVGHLLSGSVRRSGDRVRINAELVDAGTGVRLWGGTFERQLTDVFAVQEEIAGAVAGALRTRFERGSAASERERRCTPAAWEQVLIGRQLLQYAGDTSEARARTAEVFERATTLDPECAPAWAGLARVLDVSDAVGWDRARAAAERAVALAPDSVDARLARSALRDDAFDIAGAREDVRRAEAIAPGSARVLTARAALTEDPAESVALLRRVVRLEPVYAPGFHDLGLELRLVGDHAGARAALQRALELNPRAQVTSFALASMDLFEGRAQDALRAFEKLPGKEWRLLGVALAQHSLGNRAASEAALAELARMDNTGYDLMAVHAWRGEVDEALAAIEAARRRRDPSLAASDILLSPWLAPVRHDPKFVAFRRSIGLGP